MKLGYIISAYKLPELVVRLVRRLHQPETAFAIHVDARSPDAVMNAMTKPLGHLPNVHFLPRHACYWGDFGHVQATLKGLRYLVESDWPFDYAVLLTGQDYPLASHRRIAETFENGAGRVYIDHFALPSDRWSDGGIDRIQHRQIRIGERLLRFPGQPFGGGRIDRAWLAFARTVGLMRTFPPTIQPYGGSSYWCLPADCAFYVLDFLDRNPEIERFFRATAVPDEMLFQSVIMSSPFRARAVTEDLRFIDWSADTHHPAILTTRELDVMLTSGKLFARKFDPTVDSEVLDQIDRVIDREGR